MDNIKDIVKKDGILLANNRNVFLCEKIEKITMAVYMVTDFFPTEEPLKNQIREKGITLMSLINSRKDNSSSKIIFLISGIESLLKVALVSKGISEMNYSILSREYKNISDIIKRENNQIEQFILSETFFKKEDITEDKNYNNINGQKKEVNTFSKGQSKGHLESIKDTKMSFIQKNKIKIKKTNKLSKIKISRKELIIKFIKDKKEVSIKDIVKVIKGYSEKTIQRDVINMVEKNVLKKEGERRWSKYSLK